MAEKSQLHRVLGTSIQCKTGHGILKGLYVTVVGDRVWEVIDGTADNDTTLFKVAAATSAVSAPIINFPVPSGIRIQCISGSTGELIVLVE